MNLETCTTAQRSAEIHSPRGKIPTREPGVGSRGITIRHLDRRDTDPHRGCPAEGRTLWVSLINPRSLLGPLLDEMSFEGTGLKHESGRSGPRKTDAATVKFP
jgi:hypothetical protein